MFFEKLGKINPVILFTLILLPLLFATFFFFSEYQSREELTDRFERAKRNEKMANARSLRKERFLQLHANADPYFLDREIEALPLLEKERAHLESLSRHPAFPNHQLLKKRLELINENKLSFVEGAIRNMGKVKETEEKQRYPVQVDEDDLQKMLSIIESVPVGTHQVPNKSPQFVIKTFRLKKQKTELQTDVFEVEMDLLKRDFIK
jgi:hypothetical protein